MLPKDARCALEHYCGHFSFEKTTNQQYHGATDLLKHVCVFSWIRSAGGGRLSNTEDTSRARAWCGRRPKDSLIPSALAGA